MLNFEPPGHPFPTISPRNIHTHFVDEFSLGTWDFITVVCFTPKPCGTHFRLPLHLAYIHWTGTAFLKFEPSGLPFPPTTPEKNVLTYFMEGSPLNISDFIPVLWFTPKPCGTHFRLPHHLAYIHWTSRASLNFEPSDHPFATISSIYSYTYFMKGSPLSMSDSISVVRFTKKPCSTHFRLPHHLAYIPRTGRVPLNFEPSGHPFPPISIQNIYTYFMKKSPLSMSDSNLSSVPLHNRVVLISVYPITWLINTELVELPWIMNPPALHFPQFHRRIFEPVP